MMAALRAARAASARPAFGELFLKTDPAWQARHKAQLSGGAFDMSANHTPPMEVFYSATPNGWKVAIMLEELKLAGAPEVGWRKVELDLQKGDQFSDWFKAVNPNCRLCSRLCIFRTVHVPTCRLCRLCSGCVGSDVHSLKCVVLAG